MINNPQVQNNVYRRYDTGSTTVYFALPPYILQEIFNDNIRTKVLGPSFGNAGADINWDKDTGIATLKNSSVIKVLGCTHNCLRKINDHIKNHGTSDNIIKQLSVVGPNQVDQKLKLLAQTIGDNLVMLEPYEFEVGGLNGVSEFRRRHFGTDPQYILVEDSGSIGGKGRVKSIPLPTSQSTLPGSHPELGKANEVKAANNASKDTHPFASQKQKIDAIYENVKPGKTRMVPDPNPGYLGKITDRVVVLENGDVNVLSASDQPTPPTLSVGDSSVRNTATEIIDGTVYRQTLDGYATNAYPSRPSSFYYPHPQYIGMFGMMPNIIFSNPRDLAIIVGLALISSSSDDNTYYKNFYTTSTVIDNQNIDDTLYGVQ